MTPRSRSLVSADSATPVCGQLNMPVRSARAAASISSSSLASSTMPAGRGQGGGRGDHVGSYCGGCDCGGCDCGGPPHTTPTHKHAHALTIGFPQGQHRAVDGHGVADLDGAGKGGLGLDGLEVVVASLQGPGGGEQQAALAAGRGKGRVWKACGWTRGEEALQGRSWTANTGRAACRGGDTPRRNRRTPQAGPPCLVGLVEGVGVLRLRAHQPRQAVHKAQVPAGAGGEPAAVRQTARRCAEGERAGVQQGRAAEKGSHHSRQQGRQQSLQAAATQASS